MAGFAVSATGIARTVPEDKQLNADRRRELHARGTPAFYRGNDLRFIGMPVGGICAGQVNLGGDGRLWLWDVFNKIKLGVLSKEVVFRGDRLNPLGGANYVEPPVQVHPFASGFALHVGGRTFPFESGGWSDISFNGEYPLATVRYRDASCPVEVDLQTFSPFCPLDEDISGMPLVVQEYTLRNVGSQSVEVAIGGYMANPVGLHDMPGDPKLRNRAEGGLVTFEVIPPIVEARNLRPARTFENWSQDGFGNWQVEGDAFRRVDGTPATVRSYHLEGADTNVQGDARTGKLVSPQFTIDRRYIRFEISGGNYPDSAYLGLVVDGKVVRRATGRQLEDLRTDEFDVEQLAGRQAHLEVVDAETKFWGQISVGSIVFTDESSFSVREAPDFGDMTLAFLDRQSTDIAASDIGDGGLEVILRQGSAGRAQSDTSRDARARAGIARKLTLAPGATAKATVGIAWSFPNLEISRLGKVKNYYSTKFRDSRDAIDYAAKNYAALAATTRLWHDTWYDSTLPRWLLDRIMGNTATLATMTCARFANGRFYGWEGVGCCDGTCGHVWQYAQTVGRLFPHLERTVRTMADYQEGAGYHPDTGIIDFRGEYGNGFAVDAQAGYVLRTYREHTTSPDDAFLKSVYPRMKKALEYMIGQPGGVEGILSGSQHNTLDVNLFGPSSWLTSLYLAAVRAGEEMAVEVGDQAFADQCHAIFARGTNAYDATFWNGEYYIQRLNEKENLDGIRIGDGCEADQLMGQAWAHQVGLQRIVSPQKAKAALKALFKYNYMPDVGPFRDQQKAGRWYAMPGEPGLLMCTFPKHDREEVLGPKPTWASMYFNECWTGSEHEVAAHMMAEGLVDESLAIVRAVHDRHHPSKRNPWNEVECSDHYARCMSVYGVLIAASGFEYHGPKGHIGFDPKMTPEDFRCAFTAAEGWGSYHQKATARSFSATLSVRYGRLRLASIKLRSPGTNGNLKMELGGDKLEGSRQGDLIMFQSPIVIAAGQALVVELSPT
jgi:uncharacterized protein (DUF608 family)